MRKHDIPRRHRYYTYAMMIVVALFIVAGRISVVSSREGDTAFLSANDRSRWTTVATLVEQGTFEIDSLIKLESKRGRRPWDTIDKVRHIGNDGRLHYYSSKPTLLTTMVAGVYSVVHRVTGLKMTEHPIYVPRMLLLLINLPLLGLFFVTMAATIERIGASDYARRFGVACTCFGTMATPFAISLNNHLFAAAATSLTLFLYLRTIDKLTDSFSSQVYFPRFVPWFIAGASAAFAVACELPALSMFALWAVLFGWLVPRSIPGFLAGAALVALGIFGTNYWAHGSWKTPYAHRGVGDVIESVEVTGMSDLPAQLNDVQSQQLQTNLRSTQSLRDAQSIEIRGLSQGGFEVIGEFSGNGGSVQRQWLLTKELSSSQSWELRQWDDWYDYPRSYWRGGGRRGVDLGEPSRVAYMFHATLGYYGLFSITPIWFLVPVGFVAGCFHGPAEMRRLAAAIGLASLVCLAFYIARPEIDRNYGGVSVCFRWMLWFAPLWIYSLVPEVSQLSETIQGRCFTLALLAGSVFSVSTSLDTPWQSPWIYRFATFLGWLGEEISR